MSDPRADDSFFSSLREFVGARSRERLAVDEVNLPMIRHWCDAMGDHNPVYTDPDVAAGSVHAGLVAPPAMLDSWAMPGLRTGAATDPQPDAGDAMAALLHTLDGAGFTSVVATNSSHRYDRYLRPGDRLRIHPRIEGVSEEKKTALGVGHFFTTVTDYLDQDGQRVGQMEFRILKFRPGTGRVDPAAGAAGASLAPRPRPSISRDTAFFWEGLEQGELRIQRCEGCAALHHPPMVRCPSCGRHDLGWVVASGRGRVYSFAEVHHPQFPSFAYPVLAVLVELEEGTRLVSNLIGLAADDVEIGMPVELAIEQVDPDLTLPLFRPARPPRRETTRSFEEVTVGETLPLCPVAVTPTQIVAGAIASRDYQDVHHDVALARKRGSPDIFMNIMTTGGLTARFVTDWAGPEAILRGMTVRLGAPNYPGDTMTLRGEVEALERRDGAGLAVVAVRGSNRLGEHVNGTLELELPDGGSER